MPIEQLETALQWFQDTRADLRNFSQAARPLYPYDSPYCSRIKPMLRDLEFVIKELERELKYRREVQ